MKLVFLHGAPASGKLTTAKALVARTDGRLFDNHASIDVARAVFEFGASGFWELVHDVRLAVLDAAGKANVPLVIMTFVYAAPQDEVTFLEFEACVRRHGGQMMPVFLQCTMDGLTRRIGNPDRALKRKMTSAEGLRRAMTEHRIEPVPHSNCLHLDSEAGDADTNALKIIAHFGLATNRTNA